MLHSAADRQSETGLSSNPVLPSQQYGPPNVPRPCRHFFFIFDAVLSNKEEEKNSAPFTLKSFGDQ